MSWIINEAGNPLLEQFSEEGFVDCVLRISDLVESPDFFNFHLSAYSEGELLGMDVSVRKDVQAGFDADMNIVAEHVYREGVVFYRTGKESDRLIARIASLYGVAHSGAEMVNKESFTAIALHQGEISILTEAVKIKIFGRDGEPFDQEAYYESFFNVDLANGFVFWNEKDQDYRKSLIRGLSKSEALE